MIFVLNISQIKRCKIYFDWKPRSMYNTSNPVKVPHFRIENILENLLVFFCFPRIVWS